MNRIKYVPIFGIGDEAHVTFKPVRRYMSSKPSVRRLHLYMLSKGYMRKNKKNAFIKKRLS